MARINGDIIFVDTSGQVRATQGDLTLRADDTGNGYIIVGSGLALVPETDCRGPEPKDLGADWLRWQTLFACSGNFLDRPTVNGSGILLQGEVTGGGGSAGVNTINGLSGVVTLASVNDAVTIVENGQTIELSGLFTSTSGALLQEVSERNGVCADRIIIVDNVKGDDSTATGDENLPFATIAAAVTEAGSRSPSAINPILIDVCPGFYIEIFTPIDIPSNVTLKSRDAHRTLVLSVFDGVVFKLNNFTTIDGFNIDGSANSTILLLNDIPQSFAVANNIVFGECREGALVLNGRLRGQNFSNSSNIEDAMLVASGVNASIAVANVTALSGLPGEVKHLLHSYDRGRIFAANLGLLNTPGVITACKAESSGSIRLGNFQFDGAISGLVVNTSGNIKAFNGTLNTQNTDISIQDLHSSVYIQSVELDKTSFSLPSGISRTQLIGSILGDQRGDQGIGVIGELSVGLPQLAAESTFGEGDSYTRGMTVLTTNNTATSTTDGGAFIDVSAQASKLSDGSTFSFQGTSANHTILIGSNLRNAPKHWGFKMAQIVRATSATAKPFVIEIWNGSAWVSVGTMATSATLFHRYGNNLFLRANSIEQVRYGIDESTVWARKTINGRQLYWSRIRIASALTMAPTFDQFKLSTNRMEIGADGTNTYHGRSRFRQTLTAGGNVFGETGGVTSFVPNIGTGGVPTGFGHDMKNNLLNGNGDAIYTQFILPRGIDTSQPMRLEVDFQVQSITAADNITFATSFLPLAVAGNLIADPSGSVIPIARPKASTPTVTSTAAQTESKVVALTAIDDDIIQRMTTKDFLINDFYEGDQVAIRLSLTNDGSNRNIGIWGIAINGVKWTHGEKL